MKSRILVAAAAVLGLAAMPRRRDGEQLSVLCIGDGLGFDSAFLAGKGHAVTYHEVPGPHEAFARSVFERANVPVRVVTNQKDLHEATFDVIVCLDVLEHVPDPPSFVGQLLPLLRPQGRLIVHAPFYMIHPAYPTHLKRNRAHSGSLRLYTQHGLRLVDGRLRERRVELRHDAARARRACHGNGGADECRRLWRLLKSW